MASGKSDYLEKKLLDHVYGATSYSKPATVYFILSSAAYSDAATGAACNELSGGGYARVAVTNNSTNFPDATGTSPALKTNGVAISWPTATADWPTARSWYAADAPSAGNILHGGDLATEVTVLSGGGHTAPIGALAITED